MAEEASPELVALAAHDRTAFGRLYDLYVHRIYGFALAHSGNRQEAEDLTAQTFERALAGLGRYEARGVAFSAWLYRIAANLAVDRARRTGRMVLLGEEYLPANTHPEGLDPAEVVERWERSNWLLDHLSALPPEQQRALRLRFWGERSFAEVGEAMGRTEPAARQLVYRALRAVRRRIDVEERSNA